MTPLRVAVVGSGPAGFYAADALLKSSGVGSTEPPGSAGAGSAGAGAGNPRVEVDMLERLPTPWGLVRLGVAPDHPKIKDVSRAFERIAARPGFRFFGNVEVGRDVQHDELAQLYDAIVYAVGAQTDRQLGITGEELPGSWAATQFVAWYNGHPDFQDLEFDLNIERAVVVGAGNVALDVARMLALTHEELAPTDTTDAAIAAISASPLREIVVLARRGPAQAAFTTPELKELGELAGADVIVDPADVELDAASEAALADDTNARRNVEVLREYAARTPTGKQKRLVLRFKVSPVAITGNDRVQAVEIVHNELVADDRGRVSAVASDERETISCGIVFRSVGYQGVPLPGVAFDEQRATLPNDGGRVAGAAGVYCAGWIKRGPSGVIGTNKKDATETVELLLADAREGRLAAKGVGADAIVDLLAERATVPVTYAGWETIDAVEKAAGEPHGRPRVKLVSWDELLAAAGRDAAPIG